MSTLALLNGLQDYSTLLSTIKDHELNNHPRPEGELVQVVCLSYTFITLKLTTRKKEPDSSGYEETSYLECTFQIGHEKVTLTEIYCIDRSRESELETFVRHHAPITVFPETTNFNNYSHDIPSSLDIADSIANEAYLCSSGDDYSPGFFTEIIVEEKQIILRQINLKNSRSINHKEDYYMRELEFLLPKELITVKRSYRESYQIGQMIIHFSDNSSKKNRGCGDKIKTKILEEINKFEKL